jgi:hypothetical protein
MLFRDVVGIYCENLYEMYYVNKLTGEGGENLCFWSKSEC